MDIEGLRDALNGALDDDISSPEACRASTATIEAAARYIALHLDERLSMVNGLSADDSNIWKILSGRWIALVDSLSPSADLDEEKEDIVVGFATALAKFERNLVAGLQDFQVKAISHEPHVRRVIFNITSFTRIEDEKYFTLQAVLTQLLSNLISPVSSDGRDEQISDRCLDILLSGKREDDIIVRLLDSQDVKVAESTLRMLNNLLRDSHTRQSRTFSTVGRSWLTKILGKLDLWHDDQDQRFALGTSLIHHFLVNDLPAKLFDHLSDETEAITPSQSTLLKLIDADLSSADGGLYTSGVSSTSYAFLVPAFSKLSRYCLASIQSGQDDARLPKVFEGLILVAEALSSIGLSAQERKDSNQKPLLAVDAVLSEAKSSRGGILKALVDLLRQLDSFLPRIKPGQPSVKPTPPELSPVSNIKRDLVRLLGILAFDDTAVGDQVREYEGVQLLLSMTEVDESNPYLREHALFAVRNLMKNNPANQAVIAEMDPVGLVSESGELLPLPERLRRQKRSTETGDAPG